MIITILQTNFSNVVVTKILNQNKGQKEMVDAFVNSLLEEGKAPISFEEIVAVTKASFKVLESVKRGGKQVEI